MIKNKLQIHAHLGLMRELTISDHLVDLTSNDYFGFAQIQKLQTASSGATGSRLLTGNSVFYEQLEEEIASFHQAESCLIFNSGYTANLGLISALATTTSTFLYDLETHASMMDGMKLGEAKCIPFRHNNLNSLEERLKKTAPPVFVLIQSIYSMSGDIAPIKEIAQLCKQYRAQLIVDEAHATGNYGPRGEGLVYQLNLSTEVFARVHTFSKALGAHGGCVLGSKDLKGYLLNFSRPLIYTTALPLSVLKEIAHSYQKMKVEAHIHQEKIQQLIHYYRLKTGIKTTHGPIQPFVVGNIDQARFLSQTLKHKGIDVRAILPPTARKGRECLRVVFHSFNKKEEINRLLEVIS